MVYCSYNMLNTFRAILCPSSGARGFTCIITAYGVRCLGCWLLEVRYRAAGYAFEMRDVAWLESSNIPHPERIACCPAPDLQQPATTALHTIGGNNTRIASSSWWWAWKCPKHVEHIIRAINHSVASGWFFFSTHMQRCTDKHTSNQETLHLVGCNLELYLRWTDIWIWHLTTY